MKVYIAKNCGFCSGVRKAVDTAFSVPAENTYILGELIHNEDVNARIRERGIDVPVVAGIMPVTNAKQVKRITQLSGNYLPEKFKAVVDRFGGDPAAMRQAGVAYATGQIIDLIANGVNHIHVFTMNKPEVAQGIHASLSELLTCTRRPIGARYSAISAIKTARAPRAGPSA